MKTCRFCATAMADNAATCPNCGLSQYDGGMQSPGTAGQFTAPPQQPNPVERQVMRTYRQVSIAGRLIGILVLIVFAAFAVFAIKFIPPILKDMKEHDASMQQKKEEFEKRRQENDSLPSFDFGDIDVSGSFQTLDSDAFYEVVDTAEYQDSLGTTYLVRKVLAKQDAPIISTAVFGDGSETMKASDRIVLTEGEYNYFRYVLPDNIPADAEPVFEDYRAADMGSGAKDAVELLSWKQEDYTLLLNVRQNAEPIGRNSRFKLLFYKEGKLVSEQTGAFLMNTDSLKGTGSQAEISLMTFGTDYDDIAFFYEP